MCHRKESRLIGELSSPFFTMGLLDRLTHDITHGHLKIILRISNMSGAHKSCLKSCLMNGLPDREVCFNGIMVVYEL